MADRTKLASFFLFFASVLLALSGCGVSKQSGYQTSALPPAARPVIDYAESPAPLLAAEAKLFLRDTPSIVAPAPQPPPLSFRARQLEERAGRRFESGRKFYSAKDADRARAEFDAAIDLMLEAYAEPMTDRQAIGRRLDRMIEAVHRYDLAGLGDAAGIDEPRFEKAPLEDILEMTFPVDPRLKDRVREQLRATASQLPLSMTDAVVGYIHYFNGRGRRTMINGFERAGRYKPMIQRILDEEGVPQELIYLAQAESGFQPRAVSSKAATGMWQFMAPRGQEYGLVRTQFSDDRLDPEKATRAAARHLRDLYTQFGDWYLAIAAYNCGPGTVEKAVERTGYADFWELRRRRVLPVETTNYVPIILAMTIMAKNAAAYGLDEIAPLPAMEHDTIEVTAPTHLALVADLTEAPVSELAALNPALLRGVAPAGFALHVPKGTADTLVASLDLVPAERRATWRLHTVESGDTLTSIGKRYGAAPGSIAAANGLASQQPVEGDQLVIPAPAAPQKKAAPASRKPTPRRAKPAAKRTQAATSAAAARARTASRNN
jgi:membrane-bound lytic murein transglycosylase D